MLAAHSQRFRKILFKESKETGSVRPRLNIRQISNDEIRAFVFREFYRLLLKTHGIEHRCHNEDDKDPIDFFRDPYRKIGNKISKNR